MGPPFPRFRRPCKNTVKLADISKERPEEQTESYIVEPLRLTPPQRPAGGCRHRAGHRSAIVRPRCTPAAVKCCPAAPRSVPKSRSVYRLPTHVSVRCQLQHRSLTEHGGQTIRSCQQTVGQDRGSSGQIRMHNPCRREGDVWSASYAVTNELFPTLFVL